MGRWVPEGAISGPCSGKSSWAPGRATLTQITRSALSKLALAPLVRSGLMIRSLFALHRMLGRPQAAYRHGRHRDTKANLADVVGFLATTCARIMKRLAIIRAG